MPCIELRQALERNDASTARPRSTVHLTPIAGTDQYHRREIDTIDGRPRGPQEIARAVSLDGCHQVQPRSDANDAKLLAKLSLTQRQQLSNFEVVSTKDWRKLECRRFVVKEELPLGLLLLLVDSRPRIRCAGATCGTG